MIARPISWANQQESHSPEAAPLATIARLFHRLRSWKSAGVIASPSNCEAVLSEIRLPSAVAKTPTNSGDPGNLSYEDAVAQVEAIVEKIESGELGLEASVAEYERAAKLLKRCREVLKKAELRVTELSKQMAQADTAVGNDDEGDQEPISRTDAPF